VTQARSGSARRKSHTCILGTIKLKNKERTLEEKDLRKKQFKNINSVKFWPLIEVCQFLISDLNSKPVRSSVCV